MACQQLLVLLVLAVLHPVVALPGYWHLPAHTCTSPQEANATTLACCDAVPKLGVAAASQLAACCDADPACGGFTVPDGAPKGLGCSTSTTKNSAGCTTIVCASNDLCKAPGSTCGCDCGGGKTCCGMGGSGNDTRGALYIKSLVPQKSGAQPTAPQLDWQAHEVGAFVSWTIEEHCGKLGDGPNDIPNCWKNTPGTCQAVQGANNGVCLSRLSLPHSFPRTELRGPPHRRGRRTGLKECADCPRPSSFKIGPPGFTDAWAASMRGLGANYAVMVLKQHCGWAMWPSNVTLPSGERYGCLLQSMCIGSLRRLS